MTTTSDDAEDATTDIDWLPKGPARKYGTNILINYRQADAWASAQRNARDNILPLSDGAERARLGKYLLELVRKDIAESHETAPDTALNSQEVTDDLFGMTVEDVQLLVQAGQISQPLGEDLLLGEPDLRLPSLGAGAILVAAALISVLAGSGIVMPIMVPAAIVAGITFMLIFGIQTHRRDALTEHGPAVPLPAGGKRREFTTGEHEDLAALMWDVYKAADGWTDPIWGFYEQITELAMAAADRQAVGDLPADVAEEFNSALSDLVDNIFEMIDHRTEQQEAHRQQELDQERTPQLDAGSATSSGNDAELEGVRLQEIVRHARQARREIDGR